MNNTLSQIFVGIDIGKEFLDIHLYPIGQTLRVSNDSLGIKKLITILSQHNIAQIVFEPTGGYERLLNKELTNANYKIWKVNPNRIRAFITSEGIKAKTDKIDARMIALFAAQKKPNYSQKQLSNQEEYLQSFVRRRADLIDMITEENNRAVHPQEFYCKSDILKHLDFLKKQLKKTEKEIDFIIASNEDISRKSEIIKSVPGVGKVTTNVLIAQMPELGNVSNKEVASLAGVAPFIRQSGTSKGTAAIKGGRPDIRKVLFMAAKVAIKHNPICKEFYERLRKTGKKYKVALTAVMRKIIVILNVMINKGTLWSIT